METSDVDMTSRNWEWYGKRIATGLLVVGVGVWGAVACEAMGEDHVAAQGVHQPLEQPHELVVPPATVSDTPPDSPDMAPPPNAEATTPPSKSPTSAKPTPTDVPKTISIKIPSSSPSPTPTDIIAPSCLEPQASSDAAHKQACWALRKGTIAVVDFGGDDNYHINRVAQLTSTGLENASEGFLTPQIVTIPASRAAQAKLKASERPGDGDGSARCLAPADDSGGKPQDATYAPLTAVAEAAMSADLKQYDMVLSVGAEICSGQAGADTVLGSSNPVSDHADVYLVPRKQDEAAPSSAQIASTALHELLHTYGLGHSGTAEHCDTSQVSTDGSAPIAVETYLSGSCGYNQYGDEGNSMSDEGANPTASPATLLSDIQRDFLAQTAVQPLARHDVSLVVGQTMSLSYDAGAQDSYGTMPLPPGSIGNADFSDFTQLDFVAETMTDDSGNTVPGVRLMANTPFQPGSKVDYDTTLMREVRLTDVAIPQSGQLDFTIGGQKVMIVAQSDNTLQLTRIQND